MFFLLSILPPSKESDDIGVVTCECGLCIGPSLFFNSGP